MKKGVSSVIVVILILLITISLVVLSYQWLLKSTPRIQEELEQHVESKEGCLRIENIDIVNKNIVLRNCGDTELSDFIIYIDDEPIARNSGALAPGSIAQISFTADISKGEHGIHVSSNYAKAPKMIFYEGCDVYIYQSMIPYTIDKNNTYYCLSEDVNINGQTAITFAPGVQNSVLDCEGYIMEGNYTSNTYGIYLTGSSTNNNIIKNCGITKFYYGIYLSSTTNNTILNNSIIDNDDDGIQLTTVSEINIINNTIINNMNGLHLISSSSNCKITNNNATNNWLNGFSVWSSSNNLFSNNIAIDNGQAGFYIYTSSGNTRNKFINNTAINNDVFGFYLYTISENTFDTLENNTASYNPYGIFVDYSFMNNITFGSSHDNTFDYFLSNCGQTNNFTDTNFTALRTIRFDSGDVSLNYRNDILSSVWLKTKTSSTSTMKREILQWSNLVKQWTDNSSSTITATYNLTGLKVNTFYYVYNNSFFTYLLDSGSEGKISFTINLPQNQKREIKVITQEASLCDYFISFKDYDITQSNSYYCLVNDIAVSDSYKNRPVIRFGSGVQNSTLDCLNYEIDINERRPSGISIPEITNKNDTIKNCYIKDSQYYGIKLQYSFNNTLINNTLYSNDDAGIYLEETSNNKLINNTANYNGDGIIINDNSNYNTLINNTANYNNRVVSDANGFRVISSSYNTFINNTARNNNQAGFKVTVYSFDNIFDNNTARNNLNGFWINDNAYDNIIRINLVYYNNIGIHLRYPGEANKIYNNYFNNVPNFQYTGIVKNNYWNTNKQLGNNIHNSSNPYIGGNYWTNSTSNGYSDTCADADEDGFCDYAYDVYNDESCTPTIDCSANTDYLALSDEFTGVPEEFFDNVLWFKFNEGSGDIAYDSSPYGNNGTLYGGLDVNGWTTDCISGNCLDFEGDNDYVEVPTSDSLNPDYITIEAWIKPATDDIKTTGSATNAIIVKKIVWSSELGYFLQWNNASSSTPHSISFYMSNGATWKSVLSSAESVPLNQWTHVAATYNGSLMRIYINGILNNSNTHSGPIASSTDNLRIGAESSTYKIFNGTIDELKIWNRALNESEIEQEYQQYAPFDNVLWFKLNEGVGTTVYDSSSYGNDGVFYGESFNDGALGDGSCDTGSGRCPERVAGYFGNALKFNGDNRYVSVLDHSSLDGTDMNNFTIGTWINLDLFQADYQRVIHKDGAYHIYIDSSSRRPVCGHYGGTWQTVYSTNTIQLNQWYYVTCVYNHSRLSIYINGNYENSISKNDDTPDSTDPLIIGLDEDLWIYDFNGTIDEVRIWNRSLTGTEIQAEMNSYYPVIRPVASWSFEESASARYVNDSHIWINGTNASALSFDGTNDYVSVPYSNTFQTTPITFTCWFKARNVTARQALATTGWWWNNYGFEFEIERVGGTNNLRLGFGNGTAYWGRDNVEVIQPDKWYHLAAVFGAEDNSKTFVYLNASLVEEINQGYEPQSSSSFKLANALTFYFNGTIDDVRIYNGTLSQTEIQDIMNEG